MFQRALYGWTLRRALYLAMGIFFAWFFIQEKQYMGAAVGVLFAAMALFNMGCAAGNCSTRMSRMKASDKDPDLQHVTYEEIK